MNLESISFVRSALDTEDCIFEWKRDGEKMVVASKDSYDMCRFGLCKMQIKFDSSVIGNDVDENTTGYSSNLVQIQINQMRLNATSEVVAQAPNVIYVEFDEEILSRCILYADISIKVRIPLNDEIVEIPAFGFKIENTSAYIFDLIKYVQKYGQSYLQNTKSDSEELVGLDTGKVTLKGIIKTISSIVKAYDSQVQAFSANARFVLKQEDKVDNFHRVSYFGERTLRYIVEHPDELIPYEGKTGITYRNTNYLPKHTLVNSSVRDFSIKENQIVLSFLRYLSKQIQLLIQLSSDKFASISPTFKEVILDSGILDEISDINSKNIELLHGCLKDVTRLHSMYQSFLKIDDIPIKKCPIPTPMFTSVPHYRIIYLQIRKWFEFDIHEVQFNDFIINAICKSKLYEYYCLIKIIQGLEKQSFSLQSTSRCDEDYASDVYSQSEFNNVFHMSNEDYQINVVYQPVIHSSDNNYLNLYRNCTIPFATFKNQNYYEKEGSKTKDVVYTPDYVVEVKNLKTEEIKYLIIDAKNKDLATVAKQDLLEITYKYVLSISPTTAKARVAGVMLLCSQEGVSVSPFASISQDKQIPSNLNYVTMEVLNEQEGNDSIDFKKIIMN